MKISVNFWLGLQNKIVIISCRKIASEQKNPICWNACKRLETIDKLQFERIEILFRVLFNFMCCILASPTEKFPSEVDLELYQIVWLD